MLALRWLVLVWASLSFATSKSSNLIELECPSDKVHPIIRMRLFAIVLTNAPKNIQVNIKGKDVCTLGQHRKLCYFRDFKNQIHLTCTQTGFASLSIFQLTESSEVMRGHQIIANSLVPRLKPSERATISFTPLPIYQQLVTQFVDKEDLVTHTDCVLIIKEFLEKVYISVQKGFEECIIIMNEEIVGEWTVLKGDGNFGDIIEDFFYYVPIPHSNTTEQGLDIGEDKPVDIIEVRQPIVQQKVSAGVNATDDTNLTQINETESTQTETINGIQTTNKILWRNYLLPEEIAYNRFKFLLLNQTNSLETESNLKIRLRVVMGNPLDESVNEMSEYVIDPNDYINMRYFDQGKPNEYSNLGSLKLQFYAYHHIIKSISVHINRNELYAIHLLPKKNPNLLLDSSEEQAVVSMESNQLLLYYFEKQETEEHFSISALLNEVPVHSSSKKIRVYSWNVSNIKVFEVANLKQGKQIVQRVQFRTQIWGRNGHFWVQPNANTIDKFHLQVNVNTQAKDFLLLLVETQVSTPLTIGEEIEVVVNEMETRRFHITRETMQDIKSVEKLVVQCTDCHVYATYDPNCNSPKCCEYNHKSIIANNGHRLALFVMGNKNYRESIVHLKVSQATNSFHLEDGVLREGAVDDFEQYIYISPGGNIQVHCFAIPNSLLLLINTESEQFPTRTKFQKLSNDCYLNLGVKKKGTKVKITVERWIVSPSKSPPFKLLACSNTSVLNLNWNELYTLNYQPNSSKILQFQTLKMNNRYFLKVDTSIPLRKYLRIQLTKGNTRIALWTVDGPEPDIIDFTANIERIEKTFCDANETCDFRINISNTHINQTLQTSSLVFAEVSIGQLEPGQQQAFHFISGNSLHLFCPLEADATGDLFAYSTNAAIHMVHQTYQSDKGIDGLPQKYPQDLLPFNFVSSSQYSRLPAIKNGHGQSFLLITIYKENSTSNNFQIHSLHVIVTQGKTKIMPRNRLQYSLAFGSSHEFKVELANLPVTNNTQIMLYTDGLIGSIQIQATLCVNNKSDQLQTTHSKLIFQSKVSELVEKHGLQLVQASQEEQLATDALLYIEQGHIVFTASCLSTECMFLTGLEISDSSYRELVAGFPEGFRIEKYSVMLFTYDNSKDNGNFKIKINRRKGFPHYRLCSLKKGKPFNECINQLRKAREDISIDNENDERYVSGRSHELRIDEDSDDYCTRCLYFIALYSNYQVIEGSVFIIANHRAISLPQGHSVTTLVYRDEPDLYLLVSPSLEAFVFQLQGSIRITVMDKHSKPLWSRKTISGNQSIAIMSDKDSQSSASQAAQDGAIYIMISPDNDEPDALYSLVVINRIASQIYLRDGVPFRMEMEVFKIITFLYVPEDEGTFIVKSKPIGDLLIEASCSSNSKAIEPVVNLIANRVQVAIKAKECSQYQFIVSNAQATTYSVLVTEQDMISLPLGKEIPGILKYPKKLFQIYEIVVREKCDIRFVLKFCLCAEGRVMIHASKSSIETQEYDTLILLNEESQSEHLSYPAKPGIFYVKVECTDIGGIIEYTIQVDDSSGYLSEKSVDLLDADKSVDYVVKSITTEESEFELTFSPLAVEDPASVQYYILESSNTAMLRKATNCNGQYFSDVVRHHEQIRQFKTVTKQFGRKLICTYRTKNPYSYITVVPVINPMPKLHGLPRYELVRLQNGMKLVAITAYLGQFAIYLENFVDIHDYENVVLIILLAIVGLTLVCCTAFGVLLGARIFRRTEIVYVMRQVSGQETDAEPAHPPSTFELEDNSAQVAIPRENLTEETVATQNAPDANVGPNE